MWIPPVCIKVYMWTATMDKMPLPFSTSLMILLKWTCIQREKISLYRYLIPSGIISFLIIFFFPKIKITKRQETPVRTRRLVCLPAVPSICHIQLPKEANDNEGCAATRYVIWTPLSFYLQVLGKKTKLVLDCTGAHIKGFPSITP